MKTLGTATVSGWPTCLLAFCFAWTHSSHAGIEALQHIVFPVTGKAEEQVSSVDVKNIQHPVITQLLITVKYQPQCTV